MPAIVLDIPAAVTACRNRLSDIVPIESCWDALREIQQCVMSGIKFFPARERTFHGNSDPVPEKHPHGLKMCSQMECPLGKVVNKNSATWSDHPDAFVDPAVAPTQVVFGLQFVGLCAVSVIFAEIEWRICENRVD